MIMQGTLASPHHTPMSSPGCQCACYGCLLPVPNAAKSSRGGGQLQADSKPHRQRNVGPGAKWARATQLSFARGRTGSKVHRPARASVSKMPAVRRAEGTVHFARSSDITMCTTYSSMTQWRSVSTAGRRVLSSSPRLDLLPLSLPMHRIKCSSMLVWHQRHWRSEMLLVAPNGVQVQARPGIRTIALPA